MSEHNHPLITTGYQEGDRVTYYTGNDSNTGVVVGFELILCPIVRDDPPSQEAQKIFTQWTGMPYPVVQRSYHPYDLDYADED